MPSSRCYYVSSAPCSEAPGKGRSQFGQIPRGRTSRECHRKTAAMSPHTRSQRVLRCVCDPPERGTDLDLSVRAHDTLSLPTTLLKKQDKEPPSSQNSRKYSSFTPSIKWQNRREKINLTVCFQDRKIYKDLRVYKKRCLNVGSSNLQKCRGSYELTNIPAI